MLAVPRRPYRRWEMSLKIQHIPTTFEFVTAMPELYHLQQHRKTIQLANDMHTTLEAHILRVFAKTRHGN